MPELPWIASLRSWRVAVLGLTLRARVLWFGDVINTIGVCKMEKDVDFGGV